MHDKIKTSDKYCYICSRDSKPSSIIDAFCSTEKYINRNPSLDPTKITFEREKYTSGKYNSFKTPSGNLLLVPPLNKGATDIKDFANRYDIEEWKFLYTEIMKIWEPGNWVDTDGSLVRYLHIRFEKTPLYNPKKREEEGHTKL